MVDWARQKKGKFIFCQRRGIASKTRHDDIALKPIVASSTSIADSLSHIVASWTYIVACAVLDSSSAGSRRGLFHPTDHMVAFTVGPNGLGGQGEKVHFFVRTDASRLPLSTLPKSGTLVQPANSLSTGRSPIVRSTLRSRELLFSDLSPAIITRAFGRGGTPLDNLTRPVL
jgi:hypothetical protein